MKFISLITFLFSLFCSFQAPGQANIHWQNVDSLYHPLPANIHVYFTDSKLDTASFRAYYVVADLKDKNLEFTTDTTNKRRLTPAQFYKKNNEPVVIVNGTFFSFETNLNLNVVVKDGELVSYNRKTFRKKEDSTTVYPLYSSAIGIKKNRKADVAWIKTDSIKNKVFAAQVPVTAYGNYFLKRANSSSEQTYDPPAQGNFFNKWKVKTAIGGGPVLLQHGEIKITNEEERMFAGKAINDKHPRTVMGYTADNKLIILAVEGRNPNAAGANLVQLAHIMKDLGCVEALNLDGGGSSCLLINGKETIKPSDKGAQRPVPAVFIIQNKR